MSSVYDNPSDVRHWKVQQITRQTYSVRRGREGAEDEVSRTPVPRHHANAASAVIPDGNGSRWEPSNVRSSSYAQSDTSPAASRHSAPDPAQPALRRVVATLEEENRLLNAQLDSKSRKTKDLEDALRAQQTENDALARKAKRGTEALEEVLHEKDGEIFQLSRDLEAAQQLKLECQETVDLMQTFTAEKDKTIRLLQSKLGEVGEQRKASFQKELFHYQETATTLMKDLQRARSEKEAAEQDAIRLKHSLREAKRNLQSQSENLKSQAAEAVAKASKALQNELDACHHEAGQLAEEKEFLAKEFDRKVARVRLDFEDELKREAKGARNENAELRNEIATLKKTIKSMEGSRKDVDEAMRKLKHDLHLVKARANQFEESDSKIDSLQQAFEREIQRIDKKVKRVEAERDEALRGLEEANDSINEFSLLRERLRADLRSSEQVNDVLKAEVTDLEDTLKQLGDELDDKTSRIKDHHAEIANLKMLVREKEEQAEDHKQELEQAISISRELQRTADLMHHGSQRLEEKQQQRGQLIEEQHSRLRSQEARIQELVDELKQVASDLEDKDAVVKRQQAMLATQQTVLDNERAAYLERDEGNRDLASKLRSDVKEAQRGRQEALDKVQLVMKDVEAGKQQVAFLKKQLADASVVHTAKSQLNEKCGMLEDEIATQTDTAKSLRRVIQEKDEKIRALEAADASSRKQLTELHAKLHQCDEARDAVVSLLMTRQLSQPHDSTAAINAMDLHSLAVQCASRLEAFTQESNALDDLNEYFVDLRRDVVSAWLLLPEEVKAYIADQHVLLENELDTSDERGAAVDKSAEDRELWPTARLLMHKGLVALKDTRLLVDQLQEIECQNKLLEDAVEARSEWKETFALQTRDQMLGGVETSYRAAADIGKLAAAAKRALKPDVPLEVEDIAGHAAAVKATLARVVAHCFTDKEKTAHNFTAPAFAVKKPAKPKARPAGK
ncbi:hypothetical protein DIPPA_28786 [Diplonema papillatum]|nr:hypothetical protein DIPPA_28786 [Diplonema papillatum]